MTAPETSTGDATVAPDRLRRIYIIEIDADLARSIPSVARHLSPGQRCFYVGETGKDPKDRVAEHRTGETHGRTGKGKRPDRKNERERAVICELRSQGHLVYPESVGSDEWPFSSTSALGG